MKRGTVLARDVTTWVFFDLGGTLLDESLLHERTYETMANVMDERGIPASPEALLAVRDRLIRQGVPHPLLMKVAEEFVGNPARREEIRREALRRMEGAEVSMQRAFPEAREVLRVASRMASLGAIADQKRTIREVLRRDGLEPYLLVLALSEEVGAAKPDHRLFEAALTEAKCTASDAIMVGDRLDNDIGPAKAIGFRTVRIRSGVFAHQEPHRPEEHPDEEVTVLREVPGALERMIRD